MQYLFQVTLQKETNWTPKQAIRHFYITKGSFAELITQLEIASEINFINGNDADKLIERCQQVSSMLLKLIRVRSKFKNKTPNKPLYQHQQATNKINDK